MKRISLSLLALIFAFGISNVAAQSDKFVVHEILEYMSRGEQTGLEIAIVDANPKDVESSWVKFTKKFKPNKIVNSKKAVEIFIDDAKVPDVSANTIDVYTIAKQAEYGTRFSVFIDMGGAFLSSQDHPQAFAAAENKLKQFALSEAVRIVEEELKAQEKIMKDLNKELTGLIKDKDGYLQDIEKAKALIAERETNIINNEGAQETKRQQISIQEEIVKTVKEKRQQLNY